MMSVSDRYLFGSAYTTAADASAITAKGIRISRRRSRIRSKSRVSSFLPGITPSPHQRRIGQRQQQTGPHAGAIEPRRQVESELLELVSMLVIGVLAERGQI